MQITALTVSVGQAFAAVGIAVLVLALSVIITILIKNHEIKKLKKANEHEIDELKKAHEVLAENNTKIVKITEENFNKKLNEKDEQIEELVNELESMKSWREEIKITLAKFEGASHGNIERMVFKLLEYNKNLNRALNDKWAEVESNLTKELSLTAEKLKTMFARAEQLHKDGIEIVSEYESHLPNEFKQKVCEELKSPQSEALKQLKDA